MLQHLLTRFTDLEARDDAGLLHLSDHWMVGEIRIREADWIADRALRDMDLPGEGVLVLGIQRRGGRWIGRQVLTLACAPGDTAVLYGPRDIPASTTAAVTPLVKHPGLMPALVSAARFKSKHVTTLRNRNDAGLAPAGQGR
ncbi:hypothetical protein [Streptomyces sp. NPDC054794]